MADKKYRANWMIQGLTKKDLQAGDEVAIPEETAAPLVAAGALSPVGLKPEPEPEPAAGEPASAVASDESAAALDQPAGADPT